MATFLTVLLISSCLYFGRADELQVLNHPQYLSLVSKNDNANDLTGSIFANNLLVLLGLSPEESDHQEPALFYSSQPLQIPSSTWLFHVEGLDHLSNNGFSLTTDGGFDINTIVSEFAESNNDNGVAFGTIVITSQSDLDNLQKSLQSVVTQLTATAPLKYVVIVCDDCDASTAPAQIEQQLKNTITQLIAADQQVLAMTLATKESARVRRARAVEDTSNNITIATMYSDEYPTMFNLFFWTSLVFALMIISVVYVFLTLDPGADTIIYRMTAPRLKAD